MADVTDAADGIVKRVSDVYAKPGAELELHELSAGIVKHFEDYPTHGSNCIHMDQYIRWTRRYLEMNWLKGDVDRFESAGRALVYVLNAAAAKL